MTFQIPRRRVAAGALGAVAATAVATVLTAGGAPDLRAADPFVPGGPSTRVVAVPTADTHRAEARGHAVVASLGLASAREVAERLDDRFDHRTYDEVTSLDAAGRPVAITRFDLDGTVAMATVLGWRPAGPRSIDPPAAIRRATAVARSLDLVTPGRPEARKSAGGGGWSILWPRVVDGAPVRGDGVRILLFADGSVHGVTRTERALAPRPDLLIDPATAPAIAERLVAARAGSSAGDLRVAAVEGAWVAPNRRPDGSALDAPSATLRLAWVVRFDARDATAERLRSVEIWLDAGDGAPLGEDAIE